MVRARTGLIEVPITMSTETMKLNDVNDLPDYDVIIIGAGPAGCVCALELAGYGLRIALLEKNRFPRDKICGDALSPDVLNQLNLLDGNLKELFLQRHPEKKVRITGVEMVGTRGDHSTIDLIEPEKSCGWVVRRMDFDNFLFERVSEIREIEIYQECQVREIHRESNRLSIVTGEKELTTSLLIGADGAQSIVARQLAGHQLDRKHHSGAVRAYFSNVGNLAGTSNIELHFYKQSLPGYFWIFPLSKDEANVGLGMLSSEISKHKINLKKLFHSLIENEPELKSRFSQARQLTDLQGFSLPLGSKKRTIAGDRYMLTGDAAALIDPLTGEGVANAIRSGRYAAKQAIDCVRKNDFSARETGKYETCLYGKVWNEMRLSRLLLKVLKYPFLLNILLKTISGNGRMRRFMNQLISDASFWANGLKPGRYIYHWKHSKKRG